MKALIIILLLVSSPALAQEIDLLPRTAHEAVAAACGGCIDGMRFPDEKDKKTWLIFFKKDATDAQRKQAENALEAFDLAAPLPLPPPTFEMKLDALQSKVDALEAAKAAPAKK